MCNGLVKVSRASCDAAYPEYALGTPLTDWNALQRIRLSNTIFTWGISNGRFSWRLTSWWILALSVEAIRYVACAYSLCKSPCVWSLYRPWQQTSSSRGTFGVLCSGSCNSSSRSASPCKVDCYYFRINIEARTQNCTGFQ